MEKHKFFYNGLAGRLVFFYSLRSEAFLTVTAQSFLNTSGE
jgi:hypothetical protein